MAKRDTQARTAKYQIACQCRSGSQAHIGRIGKHLLQRGWAHQTVHASGSERMHKNRQVKRFTSFKERIETHVADRHTIDVAANFYARKTKAVL